MHSLAEKITDSELEIMHVLWEAGRPLSVTEIRQGLSSKRSWESTTVKTLIHRLHAKGAVEQSKQDVYYYTPLISEAEYCGYVTEDLISKAYHGSALNLVAALVRSSGLSEEDLSELRAMFHGEDNDE